MDHLTLALALPAVAALVYGITRKLTPQPLGDIPHNKLSFLVGDLPALLDSTKKGVGVGSWISTQSRIHGPIMTLHMGPFFTKVIVTDSQVIEDILSRRTDDFVFSETQRAVFGGSMPFGMLSLPRNDMWSSHRRTFNPCMSNSYLQTCTPRISGAARLLGDIFERKSALADGGCFDMSEDLQLYTMDSVSAFLFGEPFGGLSTAIGALEKDRIPMELDEDANLIRFQRPEVAMHDAVRVLFEAMGEAAHSPFPNLTYMIRRRQRSWKGAMELFSNYLALKIGQGRTDYLSCPDGKKSTVAEIVFAAEGRHGVLSLEEVKDEMLNFMLAGQDTTSASLQWGLKLLSHHPDVQIKLKEELGGNGLGDQGAEVAYEDLRAEKAAYLEAVVHEILRVGRVALFISRMAAKDTEILGHFIPKGTEIVLHVGHAGMQNALPGTDGSKPSRSLWAGDAGDFKPQRWLDEHGNFKPNAGVSLPFGTGPRKCFGWKLGILQLKVALAELCQRFLFLPPSNPELDTMLVKETVNRIPLHNYVVVKPWDAVGQD